MFNDGAFAALTDKDRSARQPDPRSSTASRSASAPSGEHGVARGADGDLALVDVDDVGEDALLVHDAHRDDPSLAFALARLADAPDRPDADRRLPRRRAPGRRSPSVGAKLAAARADLGPGALEALLHAGDTWTVA